MQWAIKAYNFWGKGGGARGFSILKCVHNYLYTRTNNAPSSCGYCECVFVCLCGVEVCACERVFDTYNIQGLFIMHTIIGTKWAFKLE